MKLACQQGVADSAEKVGCETANAPPEEDKNKVAGNSNLATPTPNLLVGSTKKPIFSALKMSVADRSGSYVPRKPLINARGFPYHEARLIDFGNSPSKKWFIVFYAWDIGKEKLVRKRVGKFELNKIMDLNERRQEAIAQIHGLNDSLQKGAYLQTQKVQEEIRAYNFHGYKLVAALD